MERVKYVIDSIEDNRKSCRSTRRANSTSKHWCGGSHVKAQKQNLNRGNLLGQQRYRYVKEDGLTLSHQSKISKKVINLLRHNQTLCREEDGAIEFCKIKFHLRDHHSQIQNWSDDRWKACLAAGGGSKRRYQYCSDNLGTIIYFRALQGHSGNNLIDPMLHDNVVIGPGIFPLHLPCGKHIQSLLNCQQWTGTWRSKFE